jgi:hypothetical protein
MSPKPISIEPVITVSYHRPEQADADSALRASRAILTLARLIGRQIAREQHAAQREREGVVK